MPEVGLTIPQRPKCKAATLGSNALKTRSNTVGISKTQNAGRERALKMFGYLCRSQLFSDGNKRTAQLVANKMLIADGRGILAIPPECKHDFGEKLKRFYNKTADDSELQKFLIETSIYN